MTDKYKLPPFDLSYGTEDGPIHYYTEAQMQQAYQAGIDEAAKGSSWATGYQQGVQAGRDSMKAEAVKAVHNCLNDYVFTAEMAGHAGRYLQLAENAIKELK